MHIAVHRHPQTQAVLGAWLPPASPEGRPRAVYLVEGASEVGQEWVLSPPWPNLSWERLCARLAEHTPYDAWWDDLQIGDVLADAAESAVERMLRDQANAWAQQHWKTNQRVGSPETVSGRRYAFAATRARDLAGKIGGPTGAAEIDHRTSTTIALFEDAKRLLIAVGPQERQPQADQALAWGLSYCGDRDLRLLLPAGREGPTLDRLPWLDVNVRVWTYDGTVVSGPAIVPTVDQVHARRVDPLVLHVHDLGDQRAWVADLITWADKHPKLRPAHRPSYLAWHCLGRIALRMQRSGSGVKVRAGVNYTSAGAPPALAETLTSQASDEVRHRVTSAAETAIENRRNGKDADDQESILQSRLADDPAKLFLPTPMRRELPAKRPTGQDAGARGYIDLVGVDKRGDMHLIETKIGDDLMLVLQGLDYYIWATSPAHVDELAAHLKAKPRVHLDFVVGASGQHPAVGRHTAAQAEALSRRIPWRFHLASGWGPRQSLDVVRLPPHTAPGPPECPRNSPPRYACRLHRHLCEQAPATLIGDGMLISARDGVVPQARWAYDDLDRRDALHRYVAHVRSSQLFALNLFAPLDRQQICALLQTVFEDVVEADPAAFEVTYPQDLLGEATSTRPHLTQLDVVLTGRTARGAAKLLLVEVKLSESDFSWCSAWANPANDSRDICRTNGPFGGDPASCFQLRNHGADKPRRYDLALADNTPPTQAGGCTFRNGANQPMRQLALARTLVWSGIADEAIVALCAPMAHHAIWRRWAEVKTVLPAEPLRDLPAGGVLGFHHIGTAAQLAPRYQLIPDAPDVPDEPAPEPQVVPSAPLSGPVADLLAWSLIAGLTSGRGSALIAAEMHPHGGQDNRLVLFDRRHPDWSRVIDLGVLGQSVTIRPFDGSPACHRRLADIVDARAPHDFLTDVERSAAIGTLTAGPGPDEISYRLMALLLAQLISEGGARRWLNGFVDASNGSGRRNDLLAAFPSLTDQLRCLPQEPFGDPAYHVWVLVSDDRPCLALTPGHALDVDGRTWQLPWPAATSDLLNVVGSVIDALRAPRQAPSPS